MDEKSPPSAEPGQNGTDGLSSQTGHPPQHHHIASVSRSCRFVLYNICKIRPYLTQCVTQLLVQTLVSSRLVFCNALLTSLPACIVKPLQMIQNAVACLGFNQPKRAHVTPLFIDLHSLPGDRT